mmetsp:Transcript_6243/g.19691  ORF Transcript_6243/g.19691 Transcript_6243/m.19691 type:complete len:463 (-) Transcript_6243:2254-3642(-)
MRSTCSTMRWNVCMKRAVRSSFTLVKSRSARWALSRHWSRDVADCPRRCSELCMCEVALRFGATASSSFSRSSIAPSHCARKALKAALLRAAVRTAFGSDEKSMTTEISVPVPALLRPPAEVDGPVLPRPPVLSLNEVKASDVRRSCVVSDLRPPRLPFVARAAPSSSLSLLLSAGASASRARLASFGSIVGRSMSSMRHRWKSARRWWRKASHAACSIVACLRAVASWRTSASLFFARARMRSSSASRARFNASTRPCAACCSVVSRSTIDWHWRWSFWHVASSFSVCAICLLSCSLLRPSAVPRRSASMAVLSLWMATDSCWRRSARPRACCCWWCSISEMFGMPTRFWKAAKILPSSLAISALRFAMSFSMASIFASAALTAFVKSLMLRSMSPLPRRIFALRCSTSASSCLSRARRDSRCFAFASASAACWRCCRSCASDAAPPSRASVSRRFLRSSY